MMWESSCTRMGFIRGDVDISNFDFKPPNDHCFYVFITLGTAFKKRDYYANSGSALYSTVVDALWQTP